MMTNIQSMTKSRAAKFLFVLLAMVLAFGMIMPVASFAADDSTTVDTDLLGGILDSNGKVKTGTARGEDVAGTMAKVTNQTQNIVFWVVGILAIVAFAILIVQIVKFIASGDDANARKRAGMGILTALLGFVLFGGASLLVKFAWNLLPSA